MSHSLAECHLSMALIAKLRICFGHKFKDFPGPVVFLIPIEVCHASVAQDIERAKTSLYAVSLLSYCGENVTESVNESQHLVKIMQSGYALWVSNSSMLHNKFTSNSTKFFNFSVHNLQNKIKILEWKYVLTDPKATLKDP